MTGGGIHTGLLHGREPGDTIAAHSRKLEAAEPEGVRTEGLEASWRLCSESALEQ